MNAYQTVTDRLVAMLEQGVPPWRKPWVSGAGAGISGLSRPLRIGGQPYRGVNTVNLWAAAQVHGYTSQYWLTYKAAQELGAQVRKGERSELAFFVGRQTRQTTNDAGEDTEESFSFLKAYNVFNVAQCDGIPAKYLTASVPVPFDDASKRHGPADRFLANSGASIRHGGDRAFYMPATDSIQLPMFGAFDGPESYYGTALHELVHWTSPQQRCDRTLGRRFGDNAYAAEELVAELGAAFLSADLKVTAEPRADHASYLASWLQVLREDNRAIFRAAALAEKACGFLHGLDETARLAAAPVLKPRLRSAPATLAA